MTALGAPDAPDATPAIGLASRPRIATVGALALALALACAPEPVARVVDANQEPVATLHVPAAQARVPATMTADAVDVDGTVVDAVLTFGDESAPTPPDDASGGALSWTHTWAAAGLYDVELAITDDGGLVGRARVRLTVDPPPDATAPTLSVDLTLENGPALADGAAVAVGARVDVAVHATDPEGNLESADVTVAVDGAAPAGALSMALTGADARGLGTLVADTAGNVVVGVTASDSFGNRSASVSTSLRVLPPDLDTDGDGLPDLTDPDPAVYNGLDAEVFVLAGALPTDLFGNQRAEQLLDDIATATPAATFTATNGYLAVPSTTSSLTALYPDAPDVTTRFAVRWRGILRAPPGADSVVVDVTADDIAVVSLGGTPVASADAEFATDFFRLQRVPATSAPVGVGAEIPLEIVVANGDSAYAWSVRFRFQAGGATVMSPEAVTQQQFEVTP